MLVPSLLEAADIPQTYPQLLGPARHLTLTHSLHQRASVFPSTNRDHCGLSWNSGSSYLEISKVTFLPLGHLRDTGQPRQVCPQALEQRCGLSNHTGSVLTSEQHGHHPAAELTGQRSSEGSLALRRQADIGDWPPPSGAEQGWDKPLPPVAGPAQPLGHCAS